MYVLLRILFVQIFSITSSIIFAMIGYRLLQHCHTLQKFVGERWKVRSGIAISIFSKTADIFFFRPTGVYCIHRTIA